MYKRPHFLQMSHYLNQRSNHKTIMLNSAEFELLHLKYEYQVRTSSNKELLIIC